MCLLTYRYVVMSSHRITEQANKLQFLTLKVYIQLLYHKSTVISYICQVTLKSRQ